MRNREMAVDFLEEAEVSLKQAELAFGVGRHNTAVRRAKDCIEFSVKAAPRLVGIEYPRGHEVSEVLIEAKARFPGWFQAELGEIAHVSSTPIPKRGLVTYGDERRGIPASKIFSREEASEAMRSAGEVLAKVKKLIQSFDKLRENRG